MGGYIDCTNIVDISFVDNGRSIQFEFVSSYPPYDTHFLTIKHVRAIRITLLPDTGFPYTALDVRWGRRGENETKPPDSPSSFRGERKESPVIGGLYEVHFEGHITGDIIGERVEYR